jgi:hypothetical protein
MNTTPNMNFNSVEKTPKAVVGAFMAQTAA